MHLGTSLDQRPKMCTAISVPPAAEQLPRKLSLRWWVSELPSVQITYFWPGERG